MRLTLKNFEHEFDDTTGALVRSADHSTPDVYPIAGVLVPKQHDPLHLSRPSWEQAYDAIGDKIRFEKMRTLLCQLYGEAIRRDVTYPSQRSSWPKRRKPSMGGIRTLRRKALTGYLGSQNQRCIGQLADARARRGACNIDSACTGTTMRDYLQSNSFSPLPADIIALYDDGIPAGGMARRTRARRARPERLAESAKDAYAAGAPTAKTFILDMQERFARLEFRADKKRALVASVMERADIKKLTEADFTASLRQVPPGVVVLDEGAIPEPFWRPQPPKLDREGVFAALNAGQAVPGASLGNGGTTVAVGTR